MTEIISIASGKGGTGKTLITACLGYALTRIGHKVLMIDTDTATDGLSLFLLGPQGTRHIKTNPPEITFRKLLYSNSTDGGMLMVDPYRINRSSGENSHRVIYQAIISGKQLYGDIPAAELRSPVPPLNRETFRNEVASLFDWLRDQKAYDYVLVDTRGGFAFETTDVCALSDSFIVVTEPDYTSFYQDRNLVSQISFAAKDMDVKPLLRAIIVNKATEISEMTPELNLDKLERSFRLELSKEFPISFEDTYSIPLDFDALKAYKSHMIPFLHAPASIFSFALLNAFSDILRIVTNRWNQERIEAWNQLVDDVNKEISEQRETEAQGEAERQQLTKEFKNLREENKNLREENKELEDKVQSLIDGRDELAKRYEREIKRTDSYIQKISEDQSTERQRIEELTNQIASLESLLEIVRYRGLIDRILNRWPETP